MPKPAQLTEDQKQLLENWENIWEQWKGLFTSESFTCLKCFAHDVVCRICAKEFFKKVLQAQDAKTREECAGIIEELKWPEYKSTGQGGMFGSSGWDSANKFAQEAHNKSIEEAKKKILSANQEKNANN